MRSSTGEKYIYATVRGLVVQVPGFDGKVRTRRVKTVEEGKRVRASLIHGLKVINFKGVVK